MIYRFHPRLFLCTSETTEACESCFGTESIACDPSLQAPESRYCIRIDRNFGSVFGKAQTP